MSELYETKTTYREIAAEWREAARDYANHWELWLILSLGNLIVLVEHVLSHGFVIGDAAVNIVALPVALYFFTKEWGVYNA